MKLKKTEILILMAEKEWTTTDLAKAAMLTPAVIRKGYNANISTKTIGKIAKALGANVKDIITCEED